MLSPAEPSGWARVPADNPVVMETLPGLESVPEALAMVQARDTWGKITVRVGERPAASRL